MDWSQILGAAGTQEQQGQIDQQLADLLARRRAYQPYQATTGIGAALGGLGDILRRKQFDTQEAGLRQQRQDLSGQMAAGRGGFLQQLMQAQQGGGQAPAPEAPGGMPSFGAQPDPQAAQRLTIAGMLSGDPVIQGYLQHAPQMAMQQQQLEHGAQSFPLQQAMERQKLANAAPSAQLGGLTPEQAKAKADLEGVSKYAPNPVTGALYNVRTGESGPGAAGGAGGGYDKRLEPMMKALRDDLDPSISRGGALKANQERLNAADRLLTLAVDPLTGGPANLTPQQMSEVSNSLATLIGGGGSSEGSRRELTPYTKGRTIAEVLQWVTDNPHGAEQQGFVKQMIDTAKREKEVASNAIRTAQAQRLPIHGQLLRTFPDQAQNALEGYGFAPGTVDMRTGKYTPKAQAAAPQAPSPEDAAALDWLKANQNHPKAAAVAAKLKSKGLVQ